jgi:hypothetical protein
MDITCASLLLFTAPQAMAQISFTGGIIDGISGAAVSGATIEMVKNPSIYTASDGSGK